MRKLTLLTFASTLLTFAQPARKPSPFADELSAAVSLAAPEIGAGLILTALDRSGLLTDHEKLDFLERADTLIRQAKYPAQVTGLVPPARGTDSEVGMLAMALQRGLDRRALTARLVRHSLPLDRLRGREALQAVRFQPIPALTCAEGFAWRSEAEFDALRQTLELGFTREERNEGKDVQYLLDFITR